MLFFFVGLLLFKQADGHLFKLMEKGKLKEGVSDDM